MNSREEILNLINAYCFTMDTGDLEGWASLFEKGQFIAPGADPLIGKEQVLASTSAVIIYEDGTPRTKHVVSNVNIEIDEDSGSAKSQSYITVFQQTDGFPLQPIFSGHYFDTFQRVGGIWCFKVRDIKYPLVGDMSAHVKAAG